MRNVISMALKDLRLLWRDKFGVFWILLFPLVFALFFGTIFGGGGSGGSSGMDVAFVDLDSSEASGEFIEHLTSKDAIDQELAPEGQAWTLESATEAVLSGRAVAYVVIPKGFGDTGGMSMFMNETPEIEVGVDPSRSAEKGILEGLLMEASFQRLQDSFTNPASMQTDLDLLKSQVLEDESISDQWRDTLMTLYDSLDTFSVMADDAIEEEEDSGDGEGEAPDLSPVTITHTDLVERDDGPLNAYEISFPQAIVWGIIGAAAGLAMLLVQEKTRGTWVRLRLGPHSMVHILASKALSCLLTCMITIGLLMVIGHVLLGVRVHSWLHMVMSIVSSGACFTGLMMIFATLGKTEQAVAGWAWGGMMPMAMLGGGMVPLMMMPGWMQRLSSISPVKWSVYSMEGAIWRGFSFQQMLLPCAILLAVGATGFLIGLVVLQRREG
ncbi:MAG: ABC transporter permease [Phycisphaerales bacterium JB043]